jgi:hypothetical protein
LHLGSYRDRRAVDPVPREGFGQDIDGVSSPRVTTNASLEWRPRVRGT